MGCQRRPISTQLALSRAREVPRSAEQKARQHSWNPKVYPRCTKIIQKCDHLLGICYKKILLHRDLVTTDILKDVGHVFFYLDLSRTVIELSANIHPTSGKKPLDLHPPSLLKFFVR
jgi:hypothetical protein